MGIFSFFSGQEWLVIIFVGIIAVSAFMGKRKGGGSGKSGSSAGSPPPSNQNKEG